VRIISIKTAAKLPTPPSEPSHRRCVQWCPPASSSRAGRCAGMGVDANRSDDTLSREISCRNAARTIRGGDFSTLWRLCIESPSQPKLASSLHNKRLSYWRLTGCGRNDGDGGRFFYNLRPLKGKRLTTFCASLRSGGPPIGGQDSDGVSNRRSALYTLCLFEAFPSRGNEKYGEEKQRVIYFMYHSDIPPLVAVATTFPPQAVAL